MICNSFVRLPNATNGSNLSVNSKADCGSLIQQLNYLFRICLWQCSGSLFVFTIIVVVVLVAAVAMCVAVAITEC